MITKKTQYLAKVADNMGVIHYSPSENQVWATLYARQIDNLPSRACSEYLEGINRLNLPQDSIPQLGDIDKVLMDTSGWKTQGVPALISFEHFFSLLANRCFPVATFIRHQSELDYLQEPDIFHEIFGHCPLLTYPAFAEFSYYYGKLGLAATKEERVFLARLYWFTVEFGLLQNRQESEQIKIYGGGVLSSPGETLYALGKVPQRKRFNLLDVLRTPYRIDIMQPIYYTIEHLDFLHEITKMDIMGTITQARKLGLFAPLFPAKVSL